MSYVDEMVQCPYDSYHLILKSRFITHLCKCRKQHGGTNFSTCPFNATHSILTPELQYHVSVCPDKMKLDSHLYVVGDENKSTKCSPANIEVPNSENWDNEPEVQTSYLDVKENLIKKLPLLRLPVGKSKAERREFFANEIQRFEILRNCKSSGYGDSINQLSSPYIANSREISIPKSIGRGISRMILSEDTSFVTQTGETDDDFHTFAIVLKNRGRGRGLGSSNKETCSSNRKESCSDPN